MLVEVRLVITFEEGDWLVNSKGIGTLPGFWKILFLGLSAGYIGVFILEIFTELSCVLMNCVLFTTIVYFNELLE